MSFQLNSDREQLRGVDSTIIGSGSVRIRAGAGSEEREIFQAKIDAASNLPRVGINRTGRRIDSIKVLTQGLGYTTNPSIEISPPTLVGGVQAIASASTASFGRIISIGIDNPGDGYALAPTVTISGGGGSGYIHPSVTESTLTAGNYGTAANSSDPDWGGAGAGVDTVTTYPTPTVGPGIAGRVILRAN